MLKILTYFLAFSLLLGLVYLLGPRPKFEAFDNAPSATLWRPDQVEGRVVALDHAHPSLKPGNASQLWWADSSRRTPYALVYLHGFSASPREGGPLHQRFAERYGYNLYAPRLPAHGLADPDAFADLEPADLVEAAKEAVAIGKALGEQVIVMATSTGATLGLYLAAADPDIAALILLAPNIDLADPNAWILNGPWGRAAARTVFGGDYREWEANDTIQDYWSTRYHLQGLHALRQLLDETMRPEVFRKIEQPLFVSYYYRDEVVSIAAIERFLEAVATPPDEREVYVNGTAGCHPLGCDLWNPHWPEVEREIWRFWDKHLAR